MASKNNPRKKKLDAICTKITMFMMQETFTDERDVQTLLIEAVNKLDEASKILVANDEKEIAAGNPTS